MSALALANQPGSRPVYTTRMPTGHLSPPKISMDLSENLSEIILAHVTHLVSHTNHLGHKCPQFFQRAISGLSSCSRSVGSVSQAVWRLVQMCLRLFKTVWNGSPLKNSPRTVHQATECQKVLASNRRITYAYQCLASSMPFAMLFVMHFAWHSTDERADTPVKTHRPSSEEPNIPALQSLIGMPGFGAAHNECCSGSQHCTGSTLCWIGIAGSTLWHQHCVCDEERRLSTIQLDANALVWPNRMINHFVRRKESALGSSSYSRIRRVE